MPDTVVRPSDRVIVLTTKDFICKHAAEMTDYDDDTMAVEMNWVENFICQVPQCNLGADDDNDSTLTRETTIDSEHLCTLEQKPDEVPPSSEEGSCGEAGASEDKAISRGESRPGSSADLNSKLAQRKRSLQAKAALRKKGLGDVNDEVHDQGY